MRGHFKVLSGVQPMRRAEEASDERGTAAGGARRPRKLDQARLVTVQAGATSAKRLPVKTAL
jgi:hypothetical protein